LLISKQVEFSKGTPYYNEIIINWDLLHHHRLSRLLPENFFYIFICKR